VPDADHVVAELTKAEPMVGFFGKEGIFAKVFANTMKQMMDVELAKHIDYDPYAAKGAPAATGGRCFIR